MIPDMRKNDTQVTFSMTDDGHYIRAQTDRYGPDQSGELRYSFTRDSLVIEHIETNPENGTGLGPLLIYLAAQKARKLGLQKMSVVGLRYPDYYARWGFDIETPREHTRKLFIKAGRKADIPKEIGVGQADAATNTILARAGLYVMQNWTVFDNDAAIASAQQILRTLPAPPSAPRVQTLDDVIANGGAL
jgi:hypothetical protein